MPSYATNIPAWIHLACDSGVLGGIILKYNAIELIAHKIATTRAGSLVFRHTQRHLDSAMLTLTRNRRSLTELLSSVPMVAVTSVGARSGQPRVHALLRVDDPENRDRFAVLASNYAQTRLPGWYYNLKKNSQTTCAIEGQTAQYIAHEAVDGEWEHFWRAAVEVFPAFHSYAQRLNGVRTIPIIVFEKN